MLAKLSILFRAISLLLSKAATDLDCFQPATVDLASTSPGESFSSSVRASLFLVITYVYIYNYFSLCISYFASSISKLLSSVGYANSISIQHYTV